MKPGERKRENYRKVLIRKKFFPLFFFKELHFLETCGRMVLDSSNIFYSPLISLLFIPF